MRMAGWFGLVVVVAAVDWIAVARGRRRLEAVAKPLTLIVLIVAAILTLGLDDVPVRWLIAGLCLSLIGDVLLLTEGPRSFVAGLASFLVAHVAYIGAFLGEGFAGAPAGSALLVLALAAANLGRRILDGVRATEPALVAPVAAYVVVISAMVAAAAGTSRVLAWVGALSFYASDALIAWTRFVRDLRHGRTVIMVTYHAGQVLIVLSFL